MEDRTMRKTTVTVILTYVLAVVAFLCAAPLSAAPRCRKEWTAFNCAMYRLGVDESAAYKSGGMSYEQFVALTDAHADIFWTAKGQELYEHSHDVTQALLPRLDDYRGAVVALQFIHAISDREAMRLIDDSALVEQALRGAGMWFGDPKAPAPNLGEESQP
jgi:hypothetical protein